MLIFFFGCLEVVFFLGRESDGGDIKIEDCEHDLKIQKVVNGCTQQVL